jgi:DNA-binding response OmpR family regulator
MRRPHHVLVVDDNPSNLEILEELLADNDFVVHNAMNACGAMKLAERHSPRIILLDVMLHGTDGYDLCRLLRRLPQTADARIVMVTAKNMPSEMAQGYDAGADAYITKPFDCAELFAAMRS